MASDLKTEKLGKKLLSRFTRQLTDQVFLFLQQDPELYEEYQALVRDSSPNGHAVRWEKEDLEVQKKVLYGDRDLFTPQPAKSGEERKAPKKKGPDQESLF